MNNITNRITFIRNFISGTEDLYRDLAANTNWDTNMKSRKTARFGQPYTYEEAERTYDFYAMSEKMEDTADLIHKEVGFRPNSCFLNYYEDGTSKMGFHGDTIKMLVPDTGIAIVSLGDNRIMQVRRKVNPTEMYNYILPAGSLFYMPSDIQRDWQHGLPKVISNLGRISMTFREIVAE